MARSTLALTLLALACSAALGAALEADPRRDAPLPARPARIVSMSLPADEILLALVSPRRIAALTRYADDPAASNVVAEARAVAGRTRPDAEAILALRPDLVAAPSYAAPELLALLREARVPLCPVGHAESLAGVRREIRALGRCVGAGAEAERLIARMDARLARVRRAAPPSPRPSVLLFDGTGAASGRGTLFDELLRIAGAVDAVTTRGRSPLPLERLLRLDPDLVLVHRYRAEGRARALVREGPFADDPRYRSMRAAREGRLIRVASPLMETTSHHVARTAEALARAVRR